MLITQLTDNRSRNMAWQSQDTYRWHLIHTGRYLTQRDGPRIRIETYARLRMFANLETPFGKGCNNLSSAGPP